PRRVRSVLLHGGREPSTFRASIARRRIRDDRIVPAVEHAGAGILNVAHEGSASGRGARRIVWSPAIVVRPLPRLHAAIALAAGAHLPRRFDRIHLPARAAYGNRDLS